VAAPTRTPRNSLLSFSLFVGGHFVNVDHPGRSRAQVLELALESLTR
jgi:hypothetical protein